MMEFSVTTASENGLDLVILSNPDASAKVAVLPAYGALLHAFTVTGKNGRHNVIDNYNSAAEIEKQLSTSYKSSKLSPFACRIPEGKYQYDGEEFEFQNKFMDGTAIHGLLYNKAFRKIGSFADEQKASAAFRYHYKEEDDGYPFNYTCDITYTLLQQNTLQVQTTIINVDDLPIPMTDGWHPYFTLGGKVDDWMLNFAANGMLEFDERLVPTGNLLPYHAFNEPQLIAGTQLDNCFVLNDDRSKASCTLRHEAAGLTLNFFPDATYPFLQIFTPDHRNSIAIENLSAAPNAFNNRIGLLMLQPRHSHTFTVHYQVGCE